MATSYITKKSISNIKNFILINFILGILFKEIKKNNWYMVDIPITV